MISPLVKYYRPACNAGEMQQTWVQSLGQEDPLEEMAIHSSILAWGSPRTEEVGGPESIGSQRVGHNWSDLARTHTRSLWDVKVKKKKAVFQKEWSQKDLLYLILHCDGQADLLSGKCMLGRTRAVLQCLTIWNVRFFVVCNFVVCNFSTEPPGKPWRP